MYVAFARHDELNQGDIVKNVVFSYIADISDPAVYDPQDEPISNDYLQQPYDGSAGLKVIAELKKATVLVISQGCDAIHRPYITVARIIALHHYDPDYEQVTNPERRAKRIFNEYQRVGIRPTVFYLRESREDDFPRSVASLVETHTIARTPNNVSYLKQNRFLRLDGNVVQDLQFRLSHFYGRYAAPDDYMLTDEERSLIRNPK